MCSKTHTEIINEERINNSLSIQHSCYGEFQIKEKIVFFNIHILQDKQLIYNKIR